MARPESITGRKALKKLGIDGREHDLLPGEYRFHLNGRPVRHESPPPPPLDDPEVIEVGIIDLDLEQLDPARVEAIALPPPPGDIAQTAIATVAPKRGQHPPDPVAGDDDDEKTVPGVEPLARALSDKAPVDYSDVPLAVPVEHPRHRSVPPPPPPKPTGDPEADATNAVVRERLSNENLLLRHGIDVRHWTNTEIAAHVHAKLKHAAHRRVFESMLHVAQTRQDVIHAASYALRASEQPDDPAHAAKAVSFVRGLAKADE